MTSPILADLTRYRVEIEAFLAWFPTKSVSLLDKPRMRNATFRHSSADALFWTEGLGKPTVETHVLGWPTGSEDALDIGYQGAIGFLTLSLNEQLTFELEVQLQVGAARATKRLVLEAGTITPFMVNVSAAADNDVVKFTAATLHGAVTAGPRPPVTIGPAVDLRLHAELTRTGS
jgi:hypothetical protein